MGSGEDSVLGTAERMGPQENTNDRISFLPSNRAFDHKYGADLRCMILILLVEFDRISGEAGQDCVTSKI